MLGMPDPSLCVYRALAAAFQRCQSPPGPWHWALQAKDCLVPGLGVKWLRVMAGGSEHGV